MKNKPNSQFRTQRYFHAVIFLLFLFLLSFYLLSYNAATFAAVPVTPVVALALQRQKNVTHWPVTPKNRNLAVSGTTKKAFEVRIMKFFEGNASDSSCGLRFFMTWNSAHKSLGEREMFAINSLFNFHPDGCLIIASTSLDSRIGDKILKPFLSKGLKVAAIAPDFDFLFRKTPALAWYKRLIQGNVNSGDVPLGQNLSNLIRLGLLYRFGGVYLDTDVIILKSFKGLKNVIGAQTSDRVTGNWTRLNNAVMIFDPGHPLLFEFIREFARTFDGNKWGYNGPYLVSRVARRNLNNYNFTVLPPAVFYPVDWRKIHSLFEGPKSLRHSKWVIDKIKELRSKSFALHLWNKQSRVFEIENGSIIHELMMNTDLSQNFSVDIGS